MSKVTQVLLVLTLTAAGIYGVIWLTKNREGFDAPEMPSAALQLNDENFETEIAAHPGIVVIDFWASWCGPCRLVAPIIEECVVDYKGRATIAKINVDKSPKLAQRFQVSGIPLLVVLKNGKLIDQRVGAYPKAEVKQWIDGVLSKS